MSEITAASVEQSVGIEQVNQPSRRWISSRSRTRRWWRRSRRRRVAERPDRAPDAGGVGVRTGRRRAARERAAPSFDDAGYAPAGSRRGLEVVGRRRRHVGARHLPVRRLALEPAARMQEARGEAFDLPRERRGGRRAAVRRERADTRSAPRSAACRRCTRLARRAPRRRRPSADRRRIAPRTRMRAPARRGLREPRAGRIDQIEPFELMAGPNRLSAAPSGSSATQPVAASTNVRSTACAVRASASSNAVSPNAAAAASHASVRCISGFCSARCRMTKSAWRAASSSASPRCGAKRS